MFHQLGFELLEARVQGTPRRARLAWRVEVSGELAKLLKARAVVIVLLHHHADGHLHLKALASGTNRRKEDAFLLGEVLVQLRLQLLQMGCQAMRTAGFLRVHALDSVGCRDQDSQVFAQGFVVAGDDEVEEIG